MTDPDHLARRRYYIIRAVEICGVAGAIFGLILMGRSDALPPRILGFAIVLSAMAMIATVPRGLAHKWRSDR
ncbi:hypothetical protein [Sphingomonas sp. Leaf343]|uniref:hypothetical protein n=1 Tax=Sphingomonas sp. Leaf343 TaxID=1736345 RepID=UPI0006F2EA00|nr:hypothetical protein [Sphingomonas sp. Leaf343]KQR80866.1 hypothetical protein ASG07_13855 [Sphingomonas sp. Leaf343]